MQRTLLNCLFMFILTNLVGSGDIPLGFANVDTEFNVMDFGAKNDGITLNTKSIQKAIDVCYKSGGGYVVFPKGRFLTGTIILKDNVYLEIKPNATILGSTNIKDYDPQFLIFADGAHNIGIVGPGFINGQGDFFWRGKQRPYIRPGRTIEFENCQNILIRDVNIRNSAAFNIAVENCDQVVITGVSIINDLEAPNTDGIDPISSSNVFISDCYIETGDDCICPKARDVNKPLENLVVTNCVLISDDSAIKCGTRSAGVIRNCTFSNVIIRNTKYGIGFYMKDGGSFEDIQFSNIFIETRAQDSENPEDPTNSYAIFLDLERRDESVNLGFIRNIMFSDININTTDGNCVFLGMPEQKMQDITLDNVRMRVKNRTDISNRHKPRGTRTLKNIAINDFANVASHFTFAHIDGLYMRNVVIEDETQHVRFERHALWARDVENSVIDGFQQQQAKNNSNQSVFKLINGHNVSIRGCKPLSPNTTFLELEGESTEDIALVGNDFTNVKSSIKRSNNVNSKAVFLDGNRSD